MQAVDPSGVNTVPSLYEVAGVAKLARDAKSISPTVGIPLHSRPPCRKFSPEVMAKYLNRGNPILALEPN